MTHETAIDLLDDGKKLHAPVFVVWNRENGKVNSIHDPEGVLLSKPSDPVVATSFPPGCKVWGWSTVVAVVGPPSVPEVGYDIGIDTPNGRVWGRVRSVDTSVSAVATMLDVKYPEDRDARDGD